MTGYIFVTPEHNHSTSGLLKDAIDYLYVEWINKAASFVAYGSLWRRPRHRAPVRYCR